MALFPIFIDIKEKKCIFIGGGKVATRKIETLRKFNAGLVVISPEVTKEIQMLHEEGKLLWVKRAYRLGDMAEADIAFAASSDPAVNESVYCEAVKRNIPVNVIDDPAKCTFIFPSVIKRDAFVVGISTSGEFPALSKMIRKTMEKSLPKDVGSRLEILGTFRKRALQEIKNPDQRKDCMNALLEEIFQSFESQDGNRVEDRLNNIYEVYKNEEKDSSGKP